VNIKKISIIGLGLIGGSIAKALKKSEYDFEISAFDKEQTLSAAISDKVIDNSLKSVEDVAGSDLVFICLPVDLSLYTLEKLAPLLAENVIVTDVCGVKNIVFERWKEIGGKALYIGGHPMTGKEKGGYHNSDPLLFENSVYILNKNAETAPGAKDFIEIIKALGSRITFLEPSVHDKVVAFVSHVPQIVSVSLVNSTINKDESINFLDFAAGGFRDMTRIASSDYSIWQPVIQFNKQEILSALDNLSNEISKMRSRIAAGNNISLAESFESARMHRDEIPKNSKGFLSALYDIYVFVQDKPGEIARIANSLLENSINVKDIELLKIREGTGGSFRLSFESEKDADNAKSVIRNAGFEVE